MNNEKKDIAYTGVQYLVDTASKREIAVEFINGSPVLPLQIFNGKFQPNETITAYSDEPGLNMSATEQKSRNPNAACFEIKLDTVCFEIKTDKAGKPQTMKMSKCDYVGKVKLDKTGRLSAAFKISAQSREELGYIGFEKVPATINAQIVNGAIKSPIKTAKTARAKMA